MFGRLPSESDAYRAARDELAMAEMALRDQWEKVAALRRGLPQDTVVAEDYAFDEIDGPLDADGPVQRRHLSELFTDPGKPLLLYQFMYGGAQEEPCSMCSMWMDGFDAVARHIGRRANLALVAQADIGLMRAWALKCGWHDLRLLSSAPSSFKRDFGFADDKERQWPGVSVFVRADDGSVRHFYSGSAIMDQEVTQFRGLDLLSPVWHMLDLMPEGRGDWMPGSA